LPLIVSVPSGVVAATLQGSTITPPLPTVMGWHVGNGCPWQAGLITLKLDLSEENVIWQQVAEAAARSRGWRVGFAYMGFRVSGSGRGSAVLGIVGGET
jgi:hypothetical protein